MKFCAKCDDPIREPQLVNSEPENCSICSGDHEDYTEHLKQEAFVEGWRAAIDRREK